MSYPEEFKTVDLILGSDAETRGVDAFVLSRIKAERQIRRLVTHLVYQFQCFGPADKKTLRVILAENKKVYFEGFERGFDALYCRSIRDLLGSEYGKLHSRVLEAFPRDKIFHGQLTSKGLNRDEIFGYVTDIRAWCKALADGALAEFQYDGFNRNSLQKSSIPNLSRRFKLQFSDVKDYKGFICEYLQKSYRHN
jgi:hypothetical protein